MSLFETSCYNNNVIIENVYSGGLVLLIELKVKIFDQYNNVKNNLIRLTSKNYKTWTIMYNSELALFSMKCLKHTVKHTCELNSYT